jgi:hypothetical protein
MRRIFTLFLFFVTPLFASYVGNPADPAIMSTGFFSTTYPFFKFTSGYIGDYISNKRYVSSSDNSIKEFGIHSQMATASLILLERIEFFGNAGGSKQHAKIRKDPTMDDLKEIIFDFESKYHFAWSAGAKVILFQWWQTYFCADFTYSAIPASHESYFKWLNRMNLPLEEKTKFNIQEWQANIALASRIFILTPYGGVSYLHSDLNISDGPTYKNSEHWGYFFGATLSLTGRFHVNFERRVTNEFAYAFSTIAVF